MNDDTIKVPVVRPRSWAPAWAEKSPDAAMARTLDLADWLHATGRTLASAEVFLDPSISAVGSPVMTDSAVTLVVNGGAPQTKVPVRFVLDFTGGDHDVIVAWLPIGRAAPEAGVLAT